MTLEIYNTLNNEKEPFLPLEDKKVKMYVCGVTVYDDIHMGHARSIITFDMVARYLRYKGYQVTHVTNFTDVDDKIIDRAAEMGLEPLELSQMYIDHYFEDVEQLGVKKADLYPKASESIADIIEMVQRIVEEGNGYVTSDGSVYLSVENFPEYGKLSGNILEDLSAGARVSVEEEKRHPMDFALWKGAKPGEIPGPAPGAMAGRDGT